MSLRPVFTDRDSYLNIQQKLRGSSSWYLVEQVVLKIVKLIVNSNFFLFTYMFADYFMLNQSNHL